MDGHYINGIIRKIQMPEASMAERQKTKDSVILPGRGYLEKVISELQQQIVQVEKPGTQEALRGGFYLRSQQASLRKTLEITGGVGTLICAETVNGDEEFIFISENANSVPSAGVYNASTRFAQGLKNIKTGESILSPRDERSLRIISISS